MQIGTIAEKSGVPPKTIRYYESIGLIRPAPRTEGGYRDFDDKDLQTLRFIQRARSLGFSVKDVDNLLALWHDQNRSSAEVKGLAERHVRRIDAKIRELDSMRRTLVDLMEKCRGDDRPDCPILDDLGGRRRG